MNFKFGVRGHDMVDKKTTIEALCSTIKSLDLHYIQLVMNKALENSEYSKENLLHIKKVIEDNNLHICMLGAYFNPVHPNHLVVEKGVDNFKALLDVQNMMNAPYVGSETGSYNGSPWIYVPKNQTEEGYQESKGVFASLVKEAERVNGSIAIEPAWGHVMFNVKTLKRLVDELNSKTVHVTIDLYNLLYEGNFENRDEIFHEALSTFKDEVKIIHLKDASIVDGKMIQLAPGEGDFHYDYMLKEISNYCPEAYLVFEGVKLDKIGKSYSYLRKIAELI
jgi:sugar phosphate isomerase/epimerase